MLVFKNATLLVLFFVMKISVFGEQTKSNQQSIRAQECVSTFEPGETRNTCSRNVLLCFKAVNVSLHSFDVMLNGPLIHYFIECASDQGAHIAKVAAKACIASNYSPKECGQSDIVESSIEEMVVEEDSSSPHIKLSIFGSQIFNVIPELKSVIPQLKLFSEAYYKFIDEKKTAQSFCSKDEDECEEELTDEEEMGEEQFSEEDLQVRDISSRSQVTLCPGEEGVIKPVPFEDLEFGHKKQKQSMTTFFKTIVSEATYLLVRELTKEPDLDLFMAYLENMLNDCQFSRLSCCALSKTDYVTDPRNAKDSFNTRLFTHKLFADLKPELHKAFVQAVLNYKISDQCQINDMKDRLADDCIDLLHKTNRIFM